MVHNFFTTKSKKHGKFEIEKTREDINQYTKIWEKNTNYLSLFMLLAGKTAIHVQFIFPI